MYTGPHIIKDGLVFGYDTGYGIADNSTATRFYPGEPTTNEVPLSTFINTSNWTGAGWSGAIAVSADYDNTLELTSTNGWRTFRVDTGVTSGGTVTVSYEYRMKTLATANVFMLNLNGDHLGSYVNSLGSISASDTQDLSNWKTFTGTFTANSNSNLAIGLRGSDNAGLTDTIYVRNLQVELNGHVTPYTTTSRSSTASLIDLKETASIDVSNVSFDSTGQPDFDGTNDKGVVTNFPHIWDSSLSVESVVSWDDDTRSVIFGNYDQGTGGHDINFEKNPGGVLRFYWDRGSRDVYTTGNPVVTTSGAYHHVVFIRDAAANNFKFYVDGELVTTVSNAGSGISSTGSTFRFGADTRNGATVHNGSIPVIKAYNKALTATEIKQNFNAYKNRFSI